jgi:organic hydroperoxide reductase OsmC/OhrA
MSEYHATVQWRRDGSAFIDNRYSRLHRWIFDGGVEVRASSSPQVVPVPLSEAAAVDPEEAFVASLASCHMLWFLSLAAKQGYCVESYCDRAVGTMARGTDGRTSITCVTLRPDVHFGGELRPDPAAVRALHSAAHDSCYIANSVKSDVRCEPIL